MKNHRFATLTAFLGVLCVGSSALAQTQWTQLFPASAPSSRQDHGMCQFGSTILLFGGSLDKSSSTPLLNDTWSWDGLNWTQLFPATNPPGVTGMAMGYDPVRNRVVMFSGTNVLGGIGYSTETWEWDGSDWTLMAPVTSPPMRDWSDMEYDPISGTMILFGGRDSNHKPSGSYEPYDDTWSWNGTNWTELFPATVPFMRIAHRMTFDKNLGKIMLTGGTGPGLKGLDETWVWDGANWNQLTPATSYTKRAFGAMAFDDARGVMVLHSGKDHVTVPNVLYDDTWEFDGSTWTQVSTAGPAYGWFPMVYDAVNLSMLVQGGATTATHSASDGNTWSFGGGGWTNLFNDLPGALGSPTLSGQGILAGGNTITLSLGNAAPNSISGMFIGPFNVSLPFYGGILVPSPNILLVIPTGPVGAYTLSGIYPTGLPSAVDLYFQVWVQDLGGPFGYAGSNALKTTTQ